MTISSFGQALTPQIQALLDNRSLLNTYQQQLATGQVSDNYAGLGISRGVSVALNSQLSAISGFDQSIDIVGARLGIVQTTLGRIQKIGSEIGNGAATSTFDPDTNGQTTLQKSAASDLGELLGLLNTQVGDSYVFSGRASTTPAVESLDHILNGVGSQAGLKQIISERSQADLGSNGLGRLVLSQPTATSVQVAEDAVSPFGFKLAGVSSTITGATVTAPSGSPASGSIDLAGTTPAAGNTVTFAFNLPDGTTKSVTLTATTASPAGPDKFTIGATPAATASNLQAALTSSIGAAAKTSLQAASAVQASAEFFNADVNNPPLRVNGPPFDTATSQVAGTASNTVIWYTGEAGGGSARSSATVRIDQGLTVNYGTRANEDAIRGVVQNLATLAATTLSQSDPNAQARSSELNSRLQPKLASPQGAQKVQNIEAEIAAAQNALSATRTRHQETSAALGDYLNQITGVSKEEVGVKILALQTRLQASLQTTALLYQTSLTNYIK